MTNKIIGVIAIIMWGGLCYLTGRDDGKAESCKAIQKARTEGLNEGWDQAYPTAYRNGWYDHSIGVKVENFFHK